MSDYDDHDDADDTTDTTANTSGKNWRREMEEQRAEARAEAQRNKGEADTAKKELAFLRAGIDPNNLTPQQKLFVKAYDGDLTAEAVKAAATEYGVIETPAEQVPAEEFAGHDRIAAASASNITPPPDADVYLAEIDKAETPEDVLAVLAKISPEMVDTKSSVQKWLGVGGASTAQTTPIA